MLFLLIKIIIKRLYINIRDYILIIRLLSNQVKPSSRFLLLLLVLDF